MLAICSQIVLVQRHGTHYRRDTNRPDMVEEFDSATFRACLKQAVHQWRPDIVQLEFTWMAQYADACRPARTILVEHDITFDLQEQLLSETKLLHPRAPRKGWNWNSRPRKWRTFETTAWREVDCVVTMSDKGHASSSTRNSTARDRSNAFPTASIAIDSSLAEDAEPESAPAAADRIFRSSPESAGTGILPA